VAEAADRARSFRGIGRTLEEQAMMGPRMTASEWKKILGDWAAAFPELRPCGKRQLGRRVGPFFVGILLERDSGGDTYLPIAHAHNLAIPFPCLTLSFSRGPRFGHTKPAQHDGRLRELVAAVDADAALSLRNDVGWADVLEAARKQPKVPGDPFPLYAFEFLTTAASWYGDQALIQAALAEARDRTADWPDRLFEKFGSKVGFLQQLERGVHSRAELERNVSEQTLQHGLQVLPVSYLAAR
jgi:hypothetical protein